MLHIGGVVPKKCFIVKAAMKKKPIVGSVVSPQIMAMAKKSIEPVRPAPEKKCAVCGSACAPSTTPQSPDEELCWVCRRLKISAWRDSDQQVSIQE
jgi:hypothetical protein